MDRLRGLLYSTGLTGFPPPVWSPGPEDDAQAVQVPVLLVWQPHVWLGGVPVPQHRARAGRLRRGYLLRQAQGDREEVHHGRRHQGGGFRQRQSRARGVRNLQGEKERDGSTVDPPAHIIPFGGTSPKRIKLRSSLALGRKLYHTRLCLEG
eukprot:1196314-Prorocentrum_minimum.AAC.4